MIHQRRVESCVFARVVLRPTRPIVSLMTRDQRDSPAGRTLNVMFERRHRRVASLQSPIVNASTSFPHPSLSTRDSWKLPSKEVAQLFVNSNFVFR